MEFCACSGSILNTGTPTKQRVIASGVKLIAVRMKADDGTSNQIAAGDVIDQAYIDAKLNHEDESKRWYPIGTFKNQEDVRGDALTESFSDGSSILTQQGVRSYTGWLINYAAAYLEALESFKCQSFGLLVIDDCGGLTGSMNAAGTFLRPIRVNEKSWNPTYVKATPTVSAKVQLSFEFSMLERDKDLRVISEDEITADLLEAEGLIPLAGTTSGISTTGFALALKVDFDIFLDADKEAVPGWLVGDFALFNNTDNAAVVITSVTEAPVGTYTFVIPAQTAADELTLTNIKTSGQKPGFVLSEEITIP
jgi:hypothetical protein